MLCEAECGTMKQDRRHRGVVEASAARRQLSYSIPHTPPTTPYRLTAGSPPPLVSSPRSWCGRS